MQFIPTKDKTSILTKLKLRTNLLHSSGHSTSITLGSELLICRKVILILATRNTLYNQKKKEAEKTEKKKKRNKKKQQKSVRVNVCIDKPLCLYTGSKIKTKNTPTLSTMVDISSIFFVFYVYKQQLIKIIQ